MYSSVQSVSISSEGLDHFLEITSRSHLIYRPLFF